ncbi:hypothetical protein TPHA_0A04860 [Tetrapisispora phaffii CBS 4417]|uniref:Phosphoribulokinase/uridine kinase domain-containing protein n=1 Tax=Tetrapisispora phaffii (strain ATCC 24235 / CBS 4417 / NBRC 1672 / NRRL Y-8282 / UCD 70-5) TaxID=1071381 RepID=G8BNT3_TETPH|nr:hypothetical protein TPHA_0A04860 [Tetrapisispora phaffii CBS 4417]CCE61561.1 hypothetical protein TPHA_0A04860 [Tetrapisispora phaffii CBS 4417]
MLSRTTSFSEQKTTLDYSIEFLDTFITSWFSKNEKKPLFLFISGPQGSGKSYTGVRIHKYLKDKYSNKCKNVLYASIDDFYLTHKDQLELEKSNPNMTLWKGRGLPGTHDMSLLSQSINEILAGFSGAHNVHVPKYINLPIYDKSRFNGTGDRSEVSKRERLPADIVVFEGWFLGFDPVDTSKFHNKKDTFKNLPEMKLINSHLYEYGDILWKNRDIASLGIVFDTDDVVDRIQSWRVQQEHETRAIYGEGLTDEEVIKFIDRYIPCYDVYYDKFTRSESLGSIATLTIKLDSQRRPLSLKTKSFD